MKWRNLQVSELEGSWGLGNYLRRLPIFCLLSLFLFCFFIVIPTLHLLLLIVMTPFISHLLFLSSHHLACYPSLYFASNAMSSNFICYASLHFDFTHCYVRLYLTELINEKVWTPNPPHTLVHPLIN